MIFSCCDGCSQFLIPINHGMFLFVIQCIAYTLSIGTFLLIATTFYLDWRRSQSVKVHVFGSPEHVVSDGRYVVFSMPIECTIYGVRIWERRQMWKFPIGCERCTVREAQEARLATLRSRSPKRASHQTELQHLKEC
jgi:hypothetical protein